MSYRGSWGGGGRSRGNWNGGGRGGRGGGGNGGGQRREAGALFAREKRSERSPDMGGNLVLSREVIDWIIEADERGHEVKVDLIAYWSEPRQGGPEYLRVLAMVPDERSGRGGGGGGGRAPRRDYDAPPRRDDRGGPDRAPREMEGGSRGRDERGPDFDDEIPF